MEIFIHIDPNKLHKHQRATNPSLRVPAACKVLLVKVDNFCWDAIYLLKITVIVNWVTFMGLICTLLCLSVSCEDSRARGKEKWWWLDVGSKKPSPVEQTGTGLRK